MFGNMKQLDFYLKQKNVIVVGQDIKMEEKNVMIRVKKEIRELLKKKKKYQRETYSEIIDRELKVARRVGV